MWYHLCYGLNDAMMSLHNLIVTWLVCRPEETASIPFLSAPLSETQSTSSSSTGPRFRNISFSILAISSVVLVFISLHMTNHPVHSRPLKAMFPANCVLYQLLVVSSCVPLECIRLHAQSEQGQWILTRRSPQLLPA